MGKHETNLGFEASVLRTLSRNLSSKSPSHIADCYLATISLLCALKIDHKKLQASWRKNPERQCPPPEEIPAITAVIQDPRLFDALASCLRPSGAGTGGDTADTGAVSGTGRLHGSSGHHHHHHHSSHHHHHHHHHGNTIGNSRKRAGSVTSEMDNQPASKAIKLSHSPTPASSRLFNKHQTNSTNMSYEYSPAVNVQVVAATILYLSFSHLDHWPVQLVRAYAEDCFGPRSWVDNENCKLLVDNLRLVHEPALKKKEQADKNNNNNDQEMIDASCLEDAKKVSDSYSKLQEFLAEEEPENDDSSSPQQRRGSLSSVGSSGAGPLSNSASMSSLQRSNSRDGADSVASNNRDHNNSKKKKKKLSKKLRKQNKLLKKKNCDDDDGTSSSSGAEGEEVIVTKKSVEGDGAGSPKKGVNGRAASPISSHVGSETCTTESSTLILGHPKHLLYPTTNQKLNLLRVRQRYIGVNRDAAQDEISAVLSERLDAKAKQNSALLQSLHSFTSIPGIRSLLAGNLDRWLQSPGLSGLARTLFTATVKHMENVEPPYPADLDAIQKILAMRLKANQLSAHIENVTAIAATIPTETIARQIYHQLLSEVLAAIGRGIDASASDQLKMAGAVYSTLSKDLSSDGIAASLLMLIGSSIKSVSADQTRTERRQLIHRLNTVLQLIAQTLGTSFDVCKLLESLLSYNVNDASWTVQDEEDRARLVFQCIMLLVPPSPKEATKTPAKVVRKGAVPSDIDSDALKNKLTTARKLVLTWFCTDYGPQFAGRGSKDTDPVVGAGTPDYNSALGGGTDKKSYPVWLKTARCLLFMENADSPQMQRFVRGSSGLDDNDPTWQDEKYRIDQCCEYGCDFDDEMMETVLKSASLEDGGISSEMALTLLENLFECCDIHHTGSLNIKDMMLAWELYSLVVYEPPKTVLMSRNALKEDAKDEDPGSKFDDADEDNGGSSPMDGVQVETADLDIPQLAHPGLWWRVTILALVMCGVDPKQIGATVWEEHPTLRALMKMVVSSRYRFPTVDCDEVERTETKKNEQKMREEESKIAEILFLPPKAKPKKCHDMNEDSHGRSRISARQQQKRERARRKMREKEAAEALAAENKRRKVLRAAQKTIILWDPTSVARKPPREAAELLVAAEASFGLSKTFQRVVEPDFLLKTIGKTTRGAIERAYDWLIPIISDMPDTIARLHASASCVLLLRAYGTEGDERAQLKELSAPLLRHVSDSLAGCFGQSDAERAFDLLMSDVASRNPDRRRCARKVLFDSIGELKMLTSDKTSASSWMLNILQLKHAKLLVPDAIKHMSTAIGFERGSVLRNILVALNKFISYARANDIQGDWDFASVFIGLLSSRPSVCAEVLDRFADVRTLGIRTVYEEFQKKHGHLSKTKAVAITLCRANGDEDVILSLSLLQAAAVLLSIWREDNGADSRMENDAEIMSGGGSADSFVESLADMLLHPIDKKGDIAPNSGLATAKICGSEKSAVSVESWVMLAKARSDTIARRAALTAPTGFLPRLLLCSGLPRASLLTMIDRLGEMGEASEDRDTVFNQLLIPSATSQWDIGRLGHRREVARKLLGRLSAYLRMNHISVSKEEAPISTSFLEWLSRECSAKEMPRKLKSKQQKQKAVAADMAVLGGASSLLQTLGDGIQHETSDFRQENANGGIEMDRFRAFVKPQGLRSSSDTTESDFHERVRKNIEETQPELLEELLCQFLEDRSVPAPSHVRANRSEDLATVVLHKFLDLQHQQDPITRLVLAYIPQLSKLSGSSQLWKLIFANKKDEANEILDALICRCTACWCEHHLASCYMWLLSIGKNIDSSAYSITRATRYLVLTSGQQSVHVNNFSSKFAVKCIDSWGMSEEFAVSSAAVAFEGMRESSSHGIPPGLLSRNNLPDWLIIILTLAKCGRVQMKYICESVIQRIAQPADELSLPLLRAVFLRLYVSNPQSMNLGSAKIRAVLMEAAEEYAHLWLEWRSPLDDQLNDMLETVTSGSGQRLIRPLADLSKKHPLLVLRRSHALVQFLEQDAAVGFTGSKETHGVVRGRSLAGPLNLVQSGKLVKLDIRHWGYKYTEYIWVALLDILCAVPGPVLFGCGLKMGFLQFLNANVRLVFVQSQLRRGIRDFRLKDKLKEVFATFRNISHTGWEQWMESKDHGLPSFGEMRNVMICCDFVDPKDVLKPSAAHDEESS